jgi:hypothetical protein
MSPRAEVSGRVELSAHRDERVGLGYDSRVRGARPGAESRVSGVAGRVWLAGTIAPPPFEPADLGDAAVDGELAGEDSDVGAGRAFARGGTGRRAWSAFC